MSWFKKLIPSRIKTNASTRRSVPEGVWTKCPVCSAVLYRAELARNIEVCPKCSHHLRIHARERLDHFLDQESREEIGAHILPVDKFKFRDSKKYKDRLSQAHKKTGETDALIVFDKTLFIDLTPYCDYTQTFFDCVDLHWLSKRLRTSKLYF